jgi:hypothetical protein
MYGRVEAARALLSAGADPTLPNLEGLSPMLATLGGRHRAKGRAITDLLEVGTVGVVCRGCLCGVSSFSYHERAVHQGERD